LIYACVNRRQVTLFLRTYCVYLMSIIVQLYQVDILSVPSFFYSGRVAESVILL